MLIPLPSDLAECTGGTSASHPGLGVFALLCYGVCHLDSWDGFAIFEKQTEHFKRKQSILLCAYLI